jgi:hypothetical protein
MEEQIQDFFIHFNDERDDSISAERTCMVRRGSARLGSWSLYWTIWGTT